MTSIPLLESESEVEIAGLYFHAVRKFGNSLGEVVDAKFREKDAADWFEVIRNFRKKEKGAFYDDPFDPRFLVKEAVIPNSPLALAIPGFGSEWRDNAFKLRSQINKWSHFSVSPSVQNLIMVFETIHKAASLSGLAIKDDFGLGLERLNLISQGKWTKSSSNSLIDSINDEDAEQYASQLAKKLEEMEKRPPVGSVWTGDKGTRKIVIHKALRDVTENGVSIRNYLLPNADEVISRWLRYYPMGGEASVAHDGAVMGYRKGTAYLIGWLGVQQEDEKDPLGFFLEQDYEFTGTDVLDVESGQLLSKAANEPIEWIIRALSVGVPVNSTFNVTTYGQIIFYDEIGLAQKIADIHNAVWFPGHLPV